jgi:hypothetical protein
MSAIAATRSSADYSAIASLLNGSLFPPATDTLQTGQATSPGSVSTSSPADTVNLSDHAKAMLALARSQQATADQLNAQFQAARDANRENLAPETVSDPQTTTDNVDSLFAKLSGIAQSQQSGSTWDPNSYIDNSGDYLQAQQADHTQADGSIESWSTSASNVFNVPSTPQDVDQWYQTQGQQMLALAQAFPSSFPGMAAAIQNHTLTFTDARSVPGLNFQNWYTSEGGESGAGGGAGASFNSSLPMFQDSNVHYQVMNDGTVLSWPTSSQ